MIENHFNANDIASVDFGVSLRDDRSMYFVPTDDGIKNALKEIFSHTLDILNSIDGDWEKHDLSEDYGEKRKIYAERSSEYMGELSDIYEVGALNDLTALDNHVANIDFYFAYFRDSEDKKVVGLKKANQFKTTLKARNRLVRLVDDSLKIVEDDVLKLDQHFDVLIGEEHIAINNPRSFEYLSDIVSQVAGAAANKIQHIHDTVPFLDLSRIKDKIDQHPHMARVAASIATRTDLASLSKESIEEVAKHQGIVFKEVGGRLQCRKKDEATLLELLDARRYHLELVKDEIVPYRATGRRKVGGT